MRIISGKFRGQTLATPSGRDTRPTADRVREAIFNILSHGSDAIPIEGARVLDLFAGTGALGLEALSRGARFCQFVDERAEARGLIRRNADGLGVIGQCKIWRRDATRLGSCAPQPPYDLAFIDPPYGKSLGEKALRSLIEGGWLAKDAVAVLEESARSEVEIPQGLAQMDQRAYGDTKVLFLKYYG
ncbi:MAG: 16S rRNA (guanine(966)-N(2))-methyltransferase RsmD [Aestuariivirgaceae bacterium]